MALGLSKNGHQGTSVFSRILLQRTAESLFMFDKRDEINKIMKTKDKYGLTLFTIFCIQQSVPFTQHIHCLIEEQLPKKSVGQLLVDSWLTSNQQSADSQPTNGQQSYCNLTVLVHSQEHRLRYFFLMENGIATDV